jgi:hypothetical protein
VTVCNATNVQWSMVERSVYYVYIVSGLQTYVWSLPSGSKLGH